MGKWIVNFRDKSGGLKTVIISAESRTEVFDQMAKRGVSAVSVRESNCKGSNKFGMRFSMRLISCCLATVCFIAFLLILLKQPDRVSVVENDQLESLKQITEVTISRTDHSNSCELSQAPIENPRRRRGLWTDEDGNLRRPDGTYFRKNTKPPTKVNLTERFPEQKAFKYSSEIDLAHLVQIKPGEPIENWVKYGEAFNRDFLQSMLDHIEISPDDSSDVRALKEAVKELKLEIVKRVREGADPAQLVNETREELQRMGEISEMIRGQMLELVKGENFSDDELLEFQSRVNDKLIEQNLPPITNPRFYLIQMRYNTRMEELK